MKQEGGRKLEIVPPRGITDINGQSSPYWLYEESHVGDVGKHRRTMGDDILPNFTN